MHRECASGGTGGPDAGGRTAARGAAAELPARRGRPLEGRARGPPDGPPPGGPFPPDSERGDVGPGM